MRIAEIIWLDELVDKLRRKHAVEPEEVEEVLASGQERVDSFGERHGTQGQETI